MIAGGGHSPAAQVAQEICDGLVIMPPCEPCLAILLSALTSWASGLAQRPPLAEVEALALDISARLTAEGWLLDDILSGAVLVLDRSDLFGLAETAAYGVFSFGSDC